MWAVHLPWVPLLVLLPILGALTTLVLCRNGNSNRLPSGIAIGTTSAALILLLGLACTLVTEGAQTYLLGDWPSMLGITLRADGLSMLMLSLTSVVTFFVSIYAKYYFATRSDTVPFWTMFLLTIASLNALTFSRDIFNLYVTLECLTLVSVSLVIAEQNSKTLNSAMRYLLAALVGSLLYLLGVAFLYHGYGTLNIDILGQAITAGPAATTGFALMMVGLMMKAALFPFHFWLPSAHANAPAPVSAILSALIVKASIYLILRLWLDVFSTTESPYIAQCLSVLGMVAIIWASIQALLQTTIKRVIAYSTVAQLGYLLQALSLSSSVAWHGVIFIALSHGIAKSAMFLAAGNIKRFCGHDNIKQLNQVVKKLPLTMIAFGLAGMSIMGLPLSSGFIGKWLLLQAALSEQHYLQATVIVIGSLLSMAYIFKIFGHAFTAGKPITPHATVTLSMSWVPLILAIISVLLCFVTEPLLRLFSIDVSFIGGAL